MYLAIYYQLVVSLWWRQLRQCSSAGRTASEVFHLGPSLSRKAFDSQTNGCSSDNPAEQTGTDILANTLFFSFFSNLQQCWIYDFMSDFICFSESIGFLVCNWRGRFLHNQDPGIENVPSRFVSMNSSSLHLKRKIFWSPIFERL